MRRVFSLSFLLAAACGGGLERVSFVTDQLEVPPTGRVLLSLVNVGSATLGTQLCAATQLELEDFPGEPMGSEEPARECPPGATPLEPGAFLTERRTVRLVTNIGGPLRLRYRTRILLPSGETEEVLTPVFTYGL